VLRSRHIVASRSIAFLKLTYLLTILFRDPEVTLNPIVIMIVRGVFVTLFSTLSVVVIFIRLPMDVTFGL